MTSLSSHSRMSFSPSNLRVLKLTLSSSGTQISEISMANSRQNIRKLVKDGFVIRKPQKV
jgi:large subunit ribosomal protein L19e